MKTITYTLLCLAGAAMIVSCNEGIDPISRVEPGPDELAPEISIGYPGEGAEIRVTEDVTSINIQFEVVDDIEIGDIAVSLDGSQIATFNEFKDYRRAIEEYLYDNLTNGAHTLTVTANDLSGKSASKSVSFEKIEPYQPVYDGEVFYMPFDGDYTELVTIVAATKVGSPGFADGGVSGKSYVGATDGYLTFPTSEIGLGSEFSAAFWYKLNATPDRSGILTIGPPDPAKPATPNNRTSGFRLFREVVGGHQVIKLNVGNGTADSWFDGGVDAAVDNTPGEWVHIAFTISGTEVVVYVNGIVVKQGAFGGVSWNGCDVLSIASGAPRFTEWNHLSDLSLYDELRLFNKALTQEEIETIMDGD